MEFPHNLVLRTFRVNDAPEIWQYADDPTTRFVLTLNEYAALSHASPCTYGYQVFFPEEPFDMEANRAWVVDSVTKLCTTEKYIADARRSGAWVTEVFQFTHEKQHA